MYVRWVVRKHKNKYAAHVVFHDAYLVQSYRDPQGRPRQRTVTYLGNLRLMDDEISGIDRQLFLWRARRVLDRVADLPADEQQKIWARLQQAAPPLSPEELLHSFQQNLAWFRQSLQLLGKRLPPVTEVSLTVESPAVLQAA